MEKKEFLKENLIRYRKNAGLTQMDLASRLGYSNKSVSKWERGESTPDMDTLLKIADVFGVALQDLLAEPLEESEKQPLPLEDVQTETVVSEQEESAEVEQESKKRRFKIESSVLWLLLSIAILLSVTTLLFFAVRLSGCPFGSRAWLLYVCDAPLIFTALFVYVCCLQKRVDAILLSCMVWTYITAIYLSFMNYAHMWEIFVVGVPLQFLAIVFSLLCNLHIRNRREKRATQNANKEE